MMANGKSPGRVHYEHPPKREDLDRAERDLEAKLAAAGGDRALIAEVELGLRLVRRARAEMQP